MSPPRSAPSTPSVASSSRTAVRIQMLRLRHETDQWTPIAGLSRPRGAISAIVVNGQIHLLGGRDVRSVEWHEVYDPRTTNIPSRPCAARRHAAFCRPARPYGRRRRRRENPCHWRPHGLYDFNTWLNAVYSPKTDRWTFRAPLPTPRSGPSCLYQQDRGIRRRGYRPGFRHQRGLRSGDRQLGGSDADGDPAPWATWRHCRGHWQRAMCPAAGRCPAAASRAPIMMRSPSADAEARFIPPPAPPLRRTGRGPLARVYCGR